MNWRPAHEYRGTRRYWFDNPALMAIEMTALSAKLIYRHFNLFPVMMTAANDRDGKRW